jgi:hypothetical protein
VEAKRVSLALEGGTLEAEVADTGILPQSWTSNHPLGEGARESEGTS